MSTSPDSPFRNHRILVIDDNPSIHDDFRKILCQETDDLKSQMEADEAELFGDKPASLDSTQFQIDSAYQGQEGLQMIRRAWENAQPYSVAFIDVRMPPGWDGIETITRIWQEYTDLQVVICTAYSDYSWDGIAQKLGYSDHVLVLKKPFDNIEVLQMAHALSKKWELAQIAARQMHELDSLVQQRTAELREANERLRGEVEERIAAEQALRLSEERFSKAFHSSPVAMAIQHLNGRGFLDVNHQFTEVLSKDKHSLLGSADLWLPEDMHAEISSKLVAGGRVRELSGALTRSDGTSREILVSAEQLEIGGTSYQLVIVQDVTDRVRLERELRQAQKMEAVGRLAAGVAHDFNNILTVIMGNTSLNLRNPHMDEKIATSLHQVVKAAERATELTRQLLAYSRHQIIQRRPVELSGLVQQTVAMLKRILGEHIVVRTELDTHLPQIFADSANVDQVVMNLAINARDAMPEGGILEISTSQVEIKADEFRSSADARPGKFACLSVRDTGHGMDSATLQRVFEPFYTTKEPGKGTGMGLATVYGVLCQHNGWVEVESNPGRGTIFRAFFPFASSSEEFETEPDSETRVEPTTSSGTILVVEDEEMLREYVQDALTELGYGVHCAANGDEALALWAVHRNEIDLLFTDVVMPNSLSGVQLARQLLQDRPELPVIYTSGYSSELIGSDCETDRRCGFLAKPYLTDRLSAAVAAQLQRTRSLANA